MRKAIRHIITCAGASAVLCALVSCSSDTEEAGVPSESGAMTLSIGIKVPAARASEEQYEEGDTYENYVDIARGNYRIYFFDAAEDKLIARFEPSGFVVTEGSNYREYSVLGKAPDDLVGHSDFKMVVLANWPKYNDDEITDKTTIADICNAEWAQYDFSAEFKPDPDNEKLIPFFGVHEYEGVTFKSGQATILDEPVTLLRALAKVEVTFEIDNSIDLSVDYLKINRYNAKGYCAPKDVTTHTDYDHDGVWEKDYATDVHLVGGANDSDEKEFDCTLAREWEENGKSCVKYVSYLPEYRNIGVGDAYSSLKTKFSVQLEDDSHTIYFANYSNGKTDNSDTNRLNIERNNIYRFHVTCTGYNFKLLLSVSDWEGLYENIFEFGNGQIVSPTSPWEDEISNDFEF